jgi:hypothetical protein
MRTADKCGCARTSDFQSQILEALENLIAETERTDNPRDMGVGQDADVMVKARAAVLKAKHENG